jgi:integrase
MPPPHLCFDAVRRRNAVQVQRWLGHHSPAFTLATYVHLLDGDLGEQLAILQEVCHDAELAGWR